MATPGRAIERGVCAAGAALFDPCTSKAVPGPTNGFICSDVRSVSFESAFSGTDTQKLEGGCGQVCVSIPGERCFDEGTGKIEWCFFNPELDSMFSNAPLYVPTEGPYAGKTMGFAAPKDCEEEPRIWLQHYRKLLYPGGNCGTAATALPKYRLYIYPNGIVRPMNPGSTTTELAYHEAELANFVSVRPPDGYTGPFGDIPADFFSSFSATDKRAYWVVDLDTLPAGMNCDELTAVA